MDKLQFIASLIGSLAWPLAVVGLGLMFRDEVKALLAKVKHAKGAGIELDFAVDIKRVVLEAEHVKQEAASDRPDIPHVIQEQTSEEKDRLYELLRERPSALILDAWRDVEKAVQDILTEMDLTVGVVARRNAPPTLWPGVLQKQGFLSHEEAALVVDLRMLRNKVAHAQGWEPTVSDALDYHRTAMLVASVLRKKLAETKALN